MNPVMVPKQKVGSEGKLSEHEGRLDENEEAQHYKGAPLDFVHVYFVFYLEYLCEVHDQPVKHEVHVDVKQESEYDKGIKHQSCEDFYSWLLMKNVFVYGVVASERSLYYVSHD